MDKLCVDIGNSRIKLALMENGKVKRYAVHGFNEEAAIIEWLQEAEFESGIYSSVLANDPDWLLAFKEKRKLLRLNSKTKLPLKIHYKTPESLGTDRIAAMAGALALYKKGALLVVNAGTCITYDLINNHGEFIGGNIAPGLEMRCKAMHDYTSVLPLIKVHDPGNSFIGYDTVSAMENGALQGIVLETEGYFTRLRKNYPELYVVLSGGNAPFLVNHLKISIFAEPYLVLKGLNTILDYQ